jgi:hypothetical protein
MAASRSRGIAASEYSSAAERHIRYVEPNAARKVGISMPDVKLLALATSLRARAEEVLAQAETMKDAGAQRKMRGIAASYVKLAERLEERAGDIDKV